MFYYNRFEGAVCGPKGYTAYSCVRDDRDFVQKFNVILISYIKRKLSKLKIYFLISNKLI